MESLSRGKNRILMMHKQYSKGKREKGSKERDLYNAPLKINRS